MRARQLLPILAGVTFLAFIQPQASAQTPVGTAFQYQGRLTDGGSPTNGQYDLEFALYEDSGGTSPVAGPVAIEDKQVANGLFSAQLDFGAGTFTGNARWLKIGVRPYDSTGAYTYLSPLQEVTPSPYALLARDNVRAVERIADLRNLPVPENNAASVVVACHSTRDDMGGGTFIWNPNAPEVKYWNPDLGEWGEFVTYPDNDDDGTSIKPNGYVESGRWVRRQDGLAVNAAWWGLSTDPCQDNSPIIQAAVDHAAFRAVFIPPAETGSRWLGTQPYVRIPSGRYAVSTTIECLQSTHIYGEDTILEASDCLSSPDVLFHVHNGLNNRFTRLTFRDLGTAISFGSDPNDNVNPPDNVNLDAAKHWVDECRFFDLTDTAIYINSQSCVADIRDCFWHQCQRALYINHDITGSISYVNLSKSWINGRRVDVEELAKDSAQIVCESTYPDPQAVPDTGTALTWTSFRW